MSSLQTHNSEDKENEMLDFLRLLDRRISNLESRLCDIEELNREKEQSNSHNNDQIYSKEELILLKNKSNEFKYDFCFAKTPKRQNMLYHQQLTKEHEQQREQQHQQINELQHQNIEQVQKQSKETIKEARRRNKNFQVQYNLAKQSIQEVQQNGDEIQQRSDERNFEGLQLFRAQTIGKDITIEEEKNEISNMNLRIKNKEEKEIIEEIKYTTKLISGMIIEDPIGDN
jgi:hypothetical protein